MESPGESLTLSYCSGQARGSCCRRKQGGVTSPGGQLRARERFPVAGANEERCRTAQGKREVSCCRGK